MHAQRSIDDAAIDQAHFRHVLSHFCSGVTVVTSAAGGVLSGMACQSFFSLSMAPPLVAFSPSRTSSSYLRIRQAGAFCINVLAADQAPLCLNFGSSGDDKWRGIDWRPAPTGAPILDGVQAWIDCRFEAEHLAGDHFITVGRVVDLKVHERRPLLYYKGSFETIEG